MLTDDLVCKDDRGHPWSDREIARRCSVTQPFVSELRASLIAVISDTPTERSYRAAKAAGVTARVEIETTGKIVVVMLENGEDAPMEIGANPWDEVFHAANTKRSS